MSVASPGEGFRVKIKVFLKSHLKCKNIYYVLCNTIYQHSLFNCPIIIDLNHILSVLHKIIDEHIMITLLISHYYIL